MPSGQASLDPALVERARLLFGHAAIQWVADEHHCDVLHIKGYALDPDLAPPDRISTDADILVRPEHVGACVSALKASGWEHRMGFDAGSPFGHAATLHHEVWGYADVHRSIPGINLPAAEAFTLLWETRTPLLFAGVPGPVPDRTAQRLLLLLHAARSEHKERAASDIAVAWHQAAREDQLQVRLLARTLHAEVGLAAAIGELERYRGHRDYALWRSVSSGGSRVGEWWARVRAAGSVGAALRVAARAPLVNVEHLAVVLGRRPTRVEVVREFFARPLRGLAELATGRKAAR